MSKYKISDYIVAAYAVGFPEIDAAPVDYSKIGYVTKTSLDCDDELVFVRPLINAGLDPLKACLLYTRCNQNLNAAMVLLYLARMMSDYSGKIVSTTDVINSLVSTARTLLTIIKKKQNE